MLVPLRLARWSCFLFFNHRATTEISTLSLHDALPIFQIVVEDAGPNELLDRDLRLAGAVRPHQAHMLAGLRSEEHTSELQSPYDLVCRLLLEKKKKRTH